MRGFIGKRHTIAELYLRIYIPASHITLLENAKVLAHYSTHTNTRVRHPFSALSLSLCGRIIIFPLNDQTGLMIAHRIARTGVS